MKKINKKFKECRPAFKVKYKNKIVIKKIEKLSNFLNKWIYKILIIIYDYFII